MTPVMVFLCLHHPTLPCFLFSVVKPMFMSRYFCILLCGINAGMKLLFFLLIVVPASSINGDDSTKCRMELSFFVAAGCLVGLCVYIYTSIYKGIRCLAFHVGRIWRGRRRIKEKRRRVIKWRKKEWKDRVE